VVQEGSTSVLATPLETDAVTVITPQQAAHLAAFISGQNIEDTETEDNGSATATSKRRPGLLGRLLGRRSSRVTLPWPQPPIRLTAKQQLSLMTHARLYGMEFEVVKPATCNNARESDEQQKSDPVTLQRSSEIFSQVTGLSPDLVPDIAQRPPLRGRHAEKVKQYIQFFLFPFSLILLTAPSRNKSNFLLTSQPTCVLPRWHV
jgi:hypothetical protein